MDKSPLFKGEHRYRTRTKGSTGLTGVFENVSLGDEDRLKRRNSDCSENCLLTSEHSQMGNNIDNSGNCNNLNISNRRMVPVKLKMSDIPRSSNSNCNSAIVSSGLSSRARLASYPGGLAAVGTPISAMLSESYYSCSAMETDDSMLECAGIKGGEDMCKVHGGVCGARAENIQHHNKKGPHVKVLSNLLTSSADEVYCKNNKGHGNNKVVKTKQFGRVGGDMANFTPVVMVEHSNNTNGEGLNVNNVNSGCSNLSNINIQNHGCHNNIINSKNHQHVIGEDQDSPNDHITSNDADDETGLLLTRRGSSPKLSLSEDINIHNQIVHEIDSPHKIMETVTSPVIIVEDSFCCDRNDASNDTDRVQQILEGDVNISSAACVLNFNESGLVGPEQKHCQHSTETYAVPRGK